MGTQRLEAFTDGVLAIVITIMVLEMKVPHGATVEALLSSLPILLTYVLSFVNVGIFWNNHHHMLHAASRVDGKVLWANLSLLFWLSLVPFVIRWIDEAGFQPLPTAAYGTVLAMAAIAYLFVGAGACRVQWTKVDTGDGRGQRPQGHNFVGSLHERYPARIFSTMDCDRFVRRRRTCLVFARPTHRIVEEDLTFIRRAPAAQRMAVVTIARM